jgi:hypothetical protein
MASLTDVKGSRAGAFLLAGGLSALLVAATVFGGSPEDVLAAVPAILLSFALAAGCYPGEKVIAKLASKGRRLTFSRASAPAQRSDVLPGKRLLALLAGSRSLRGPPAAPTIVS